MHDSGSAREGSYRMRDRHSGHPVRREHSSTRKETSFLEKSEQSDENHKSKVQNYDIKNSLHARDSSSEERSKEKDRECILKHKKVEERSNTEAHQRHEKNNEARERSSRWQKGEEFSDKQDKSERNHRSKSSKRLREEHRLHDHLSDYIDDRKIRSSSCSSEEYFRHSVGAQDRYDGRYCSNDCDSSRDRFCPSDNASDKDFSLQNRSHYNKQSTERRMDQSRSRDRTRSTTHGNGKHDKKGKMMKQGINEDISTTDESPGRWQMTENDAVSQETYGHSVEGWSNQHKKASESYEKLIHCREKRKREVNSSDSDEMLDRRTHKNYS